MMFPLRVSVFALGLIGTAAWAQSAPQGLTLDTFLDKQTARIMAADTDGDGRVSRAEMTAAAANGKRDPARMFDRMDANGDGYLDRGEIRAALKQRFRRMDRDGDGVVTPDERMNGRMQGRQHARPEGNDMPDAADPAAPPRP